MAKTGNRVQVTENRQKMKETFFVFLFALSLSRVHVNICTLSARLQPSESYHFTFIVQMCRLFK